MDKSRKSRGLGRGLSALMAEGSDGLGDPSAAPAGQRSAPVESLIPNPDQPRKTFVDSDLDELAASIREKGIIQPLIVRPHRDGGGRYEIVAGERRWRAAQRAQLHTVPIVVRDLSDTEVLEFAIIENIQREDLNPIEEALGYRQLIDRFGHTQDQVAQALGRSRSHIANLLRLLTLPEPVLAHVRDGRLTAGHARALVTVDDPMALAAKVVADGLSVRETERLVRAKQNRPQPSETQAKGPRKPEKDADTRALENDLSAQLGMRVTIEHLDISGAGQMTIRYRSLSHLDRLCLLLSALPQDETI